MPIECEKISAQAQMDAINAAMMEWAVWQYGEFVSENGYLPDSGKELMGQMILIADKVDRHFQKQGSLEGLKVNIGSCLTKYDQGVYITNSLIRGFIDHGFIDPKKMERFIDRDFLKFPSSIERLEIIREKISGREDRFDYFLADKGPNWVETG